MKRPFSLLEVVIALSLTAILLSCLFSCYRHLALSKLKLEKARRALYPKLFVQARLIQIFDNIEDSHSLYSDKGGTLHFHFDNRLDRDPKYCGLLEGTLFLEDKKLTLELKDKEQNTTRPEILLKEVNQLTFSFFDLKKKEWQDNWKGPLFPAQVGIQFDQEKMTFSLPTTKHEIIYE